MGASWKIGVALAAATVGLAVSAARANLVANASFETPTVSGAFDSSVPTSWDVLGVAGNNSPLVGPSSIDHIGGYWQPADGVQSLDMNGLNYGVIGQTLNTVSGESYKVQFALSGNPDGGPLPKSLQVDLIPNAPVSASARPFAPVGLGTDGSPIALSGVATTDYENVFTFAGGNSKTDMQWQLVSFYFTANSSSEYLQFTSRTVAYSGNSTYPNAFGPALDAVTVVPVPLPAAAGIGLSMLGGSGVLAGVRKRLGRRSRIV